jgi:hypothetical protein
MVAVRSTPDRADRHPYRAHGRHTSAPARVVKRLISRHLTSHLRATNPRRLQRAEGRATSPDPSAPTLVEHHLFDDAYLVTRDVWPEFDPRDPVALP